MCVVEARRPYWNSAVQIKITPSLRICTREEQLPGIQRRMKRHYWKGGGRGLGVGCRCMNETGSLKMACQIWRIQVAPSCLHTRSEDNAELERTILENPEATIDERAGELKISHGSMRHTIRNLLQFLRCFCDGWVISHFSSRLFLSYLLYSASIQIPRWELLFTLFSGNNQIWYWWQNVGMNIFSISYFFHTDAKISSQVLWDTSKGFPRFFFFRH